MKPYSPEIPTLKEALKRPCKHRDMALALEPMPNYCKTPDGPNETPIAFWAAWDLKDRPRRIALLLDDCQEEYRAYAGDILPNIVSILAAFRKARSHRDGVCIAWSAWSRRFDDGISNAMDRWYGPRGLRPDTPENAAYVFTGAPGLRPLAEIAPTEDEEADGWFYHGKHLDMFWTFDEDGSSYLDRKSRPTRSIPSSSSGFGRMNASSARPMPGIRGVMTLSWSEMPSRQLRPTRKSP